MQIKMWRTTKRDNSTATPASKPAWFTNEITFDVKMKETTDVLSPSFILNISGHDGQNYVQAFGRYYWVTNIVTLANNLWEIQCKIDVLGSYRGHIRNTQAFVLYDSTANSELPDRRLGVRTTPTTSKAEAQMPWLFNTGAGTYFVAITGNHENEAGADATGVYSMPYSSIEDLGYEFDDDFKELIDDGMDQSGYNTQQAIYDATVSVLRSNLNTAIQNNNVAEAIGYGFMIASTFFEYVFKLIVLYVIGLIIGLFNYIRAMFVGGDALKNIKAAYWLPFVITQGTAVSQIALGDWVESIAGAKKINDAIMENAVSVAIPWQYSDWRNVSNTEIQLFIPLIGLVNIPASAVKGQSNLIVRFALNVFGGNLAVKILCGDVCLGSFGADVSSPVLVGNSNVNVGAVTNTIAAGASLAVGLATGSAAITAGGVVNGIASGFESLASVNTTVGGIGGGCGNGLGTTIVCTTICHNTSDAPSDLINIIGTPTNVLKTLSGSGFCQTMQAHMSMAAVQGESYPTEAEVNQVNSALNTGVFLE